MARELLEDEGATVELVGHGGEAVQAIAASPQRFDLVLMDLQMPVMDGLEATRIIRHRLGRHDLPIVAMTANAMASDRAACLDAGMNDHVGKPFDVTQLVRIILRHLGREAAGSAVTPHSTAESAADDHHDPVVAAAREAGIEMTAALQRLGGRRPVYMRLAAGFLDDLAHLPATLARHVAAAHRDDLVRTLHTAKGVAATLGMTPLAAALKDAEGAARELDTDAMPVVAADFLAKVNAEIERGVAALQSLASASEGAAAPAPAPAARVDLHEVRRTLEHMVELLADSDLAVIEEARRLDHLFAGRAPGWLADLCRSIDTMDFDAAIRDCRAQLEELAVVTTGAP